MSTAIFGQKGGGGGATESPNTLRSAATARIIDLIAEGPIEGIVGGLKGVYLDNTPIQNADGSYNYDGVQITERFGTPDQEAIPGFSAAETEFSVNAEVTHVTPVTRTVTDASVDAVRVTVGVSSLVKTDVNSGNMGGASVRMLIEYKTASGAYVIAREVDITGKTTSSYQRAFRVNLPRGGAPWSIRVSRVTADSTEDSSLSDGTVFFSYTEIVDAKLTYPDSAIVGLEIDSQKSAGSTRNRLYKVRGLISSVPSNYNPLTRTYSTPFWDGTFKQAWHSNPAWVLYALATNPRFGLGDFIPAGSIDKFALYNIGRYCDEMVPDGYGGVEPRFAFNGVISTRQEAARVLDAVASAFRGMIYWGSGTIVATQDSPDTVAKLVTPANVIGGNFEYTGSALRTRNSSVAVTWNDPADFGKQSVLLVQKDELIRKFGDRRKEITAIGCTSRGQANRLAEWTLFTEQYETEVVTYQAALDHADLRPGQLISVADPSYAGARFGGRLVQATLSGSLTLDAPIAIIGGEEYTIALVAPDGDIQTYTIDPATPPGDHVNLQLTTQFASNADVPIVGAMWVISSAAVEPRTFRVISNYEKKANVFEITAVQHVPSKYAHIERDIPLDDVVYSQIPTGQLPVPAGVAVVPYRVKDAGSEAKLWFMVSWNTQPDPRIKGYQVWVTEPSEAERLIYSGSGESVNAVMNTAVVGDFTFRVRAVQLGDNNYSASATMVVSSADAFVPPAMPTGWAASQRLYSIVLHGDDHPSVDFKSFRIYGAESEAGPYIPIGEAKTAQFSRPVQSEDTIKYFKVSALDYSGDESALTSAITMEAAKAGAADIDARGLSILDLYGEEVFGSDGHISTGAYITVDGSNIHLSEMAVNSLVPAINFVGSFAVAPTSVSLGTAWKQNSVYKNTTDGKSYILTGTPLAWQVYLEDGKLFSLSVESTNGTVFRVGSSTTTMLKARVFKNGAEVTSETPDSWFRWRRVSLVNPSPPNDDATFNSNYASGYKQININVDAVSSRATFFCDIIST